MRSVLVTSVGASTRIEGAKLSDEEVDRVMQGLTTSQLAERDYQQVQGYLEVLNNVFTGFEMLPLRVIANFLVEFLKIHQFQDGNGRLSRVLTNLLLLRSGYQFVKYISHDKLIEERKDEYYIALRKAQETFDTEKDTIAPWLNFFFSVIKEQAIKALVYLEDEKFEDTLSPKQLEVWKYLSGVGDASRGDIVKATGIAEATINQAIDRLIELGKIKRVGRGRATRYVKL